ncbi:MAG: TauD/TfdA family dioxygenase [Pseudomonadales bacterium]|nr:TauD/TfdA family dioxygenase [Pseudomonadales bacterium]
MILTSVEVAYRMTGLLLSAVAMEEIFEPRGMNRTQDRTDGWVGGRADTWRGHWQENPASRAGADARRMVDDETYAADVAKTIRDRDASDALAGDAPLASKNLSLEPLSPGIGVIIHGIDLASPTEAEVADVWNLLMERKVVFFRDQGHITRDQHIQFGKCFAKVGLAFGRQQALTAGNNSPNDHPEILKLYADEPRPFAASNWHSDVTWSNRPPLGSILLSRKSPPVGGDTVFVDAFALWDSLSPVLKEFFEGRRANHGRAGKNEVTHPICRTHPVTGRQALYINPTFTNSICDMGTAESSQLLAQLYAKMYSTPEHACRFRWFDGSVAMWDNRSCQHYAVGDFWPHERKMERVTLLEPKAADEVPFWLDAEGNRHHGEVLTSEAEISTPLGMS